jgi:hypothetical protein
MKKFEVVVSTKSFITIAVVAEDEFEAANLVEEKIGTGDEVVSVKQVGFKEE